MGCMPTKAEIMSQSQSLQDLDKMLDNSKSGEIIELDKGGILIKTSLGNIQYGIPPRNGERLSFPWNAGAGVLHHPQNQIRLERWDKSNGVRVPSLLQLLPSEEKQN